MDSPGEFYTILFYDQVTGKKLFLSFHPDGCDKVLTAKNGTVTSPGYPEPYPDPTRNVVCKTVIVAPPGKQVQFSFNKIDLGGPDCENSDKFEVISE